jgi:hypothetical protein
VHTDQIQWFSAVSANLSAAAKAQGRPQAPALAWQHIPLPQHQTIISHKIPIVGQYHETVCCPEIDTGLHDAFRAAGDVKALTVGHDHTNDYCGEYEGVYYCYDGHGSYGASGYGEPDWPIRARVWHVSAMGATVESYKRLDPLAGGAPEPAGGAIDLQTIYSNAPVARLAVSLTQGSPACPEGFAADHDDLNAGAGGNYAYLCVSRATSASAGSLVVGVTAVVGAAPLACPAGFEEAAGANGNVKRGSRATAAALICFRTATASSSADTRVATDVSVVQGRGGAAPRCLAGYEAASPDLSGGAGERSVLCVRWEQRTAEVEARGAWAAATRLPRHGEWGFSTLLAADKSDAAAARLLERRSSA